VITREVIRWAYATFEGHQATITDLIAEGDKVVALLATRGGHSGEFEGIPPTGKQWTNTGFAFCSFANGKIAEQTMLFDVLGHLKQFGATVAPPAAPGT
jgi:predicted ester cyclase